MSFHPTVPMKRQVRLRAGMFGICIVEESTYAQAGNRVWRKLTWPLTFNHTIGSGIEICPPPPPSDNQ
jgi:hypothetical protein